MSSTNPRLLVTAASGKLGRLVIENLLKTWPAERIVATVRHRAAQPQLAALGIEVQIADYDRPDTLDAALPGNDRMLLISSNALGRRVAQHQTLSWRHKELA